MNNKNSKNKSLKKIIDAFNKKAFLIFIFSLMWPIGFFIYNEIINNDIEHISLGRIIAYFGPMITLPFIGYLLQRRFENEEELKSATRKISELLVNIVQKKQLGIRYENSNLIKCWEHNNCRKTDCPANNSQNLRCWQIAGTYCIDKDNATGFLAQKIDDCKKCDVYNKSTPTELTAIGEDFNNMMIILEHMSSEQYQDFMNFVDSLGKLIEMKDPYTGGKHSPAVRKHALGIAKYLNLNLKQIENLKTASALHDIGKIGIKGTILNKNGPLDDIEFEEIKKHPLIGEDAIKSIGKLKDVRKIIRYHHERFDGKMDGKYCSYTGEVKGEKIPIEARIITIADSYDAMTSDRPYRKALDKEEAIKRIEIDKGKQFDPKCVEAFFEYINSTKS